MYFLSGIDFDTNCLQQLNAWAVQQIKGNLSGVKAWFATRAHRKNVFVSGSAVEFLPLGKPRVDSLCRGLGRALMERGLNLVSGFGLGVGGNVLLGAMEKLYEVKRSELEDRTILRPFPQGASASLWTRYREEMLDRARFAIYLLGNKDSGGATVPADGMREEFGIATARGVYPIPIGASGHVAADIWKEVNADLKKFYPGKDAAVGPLFQTLNNAAATDAQIIDAVFDIISNVMA